MAINYKDSLFYLNVIYILKTDNNNTNVFLGDCRLFEKRAF